MVQLLQGDEVLVSIPVNIQNILYSNWKGVYRIQEQIDVSMYIVAEGRQMRKHIIYDEPEDSAAEDSESGPFNSVLK